MKNFIRALGSTGIEVSALGLGTVKFGRNQGVKYPNSFTIPEDNQVSNILDCAKDQGIRLLDTAPAYGNSEERLGQLLTQRQEWVIATKVGEEFEHGESTFDFSAQHTRLSVERSLKRLRTDFLDIVLIHSDGNDLDIINNSDCIQTLQRCQQEGMIRAIGMSTKTIEGGLQAASLLDVVMITWNLEQQDKDVLDYAQAHNKGVLVKKGLLSGHATNTESSDSAQLSGIERSFENIFKHSNIHSAIIGSINPEHIRHNCELAKAILQRAS